jgi:hypothetical protein
MLHIVNMVCSVALMTNTTPTEQSPAEQFAATSGVGTFPADTRDDDRTVTFSEHVEVIAWRGADGALVISIDPAAHVDVMRVIVADEVAHTSTAATRADVAL